MQAQVCGVRAVCVSVAHKPAATLRRGSAACRRTHTPARHPPQRAPVRSLTSRPAPQRTPFLRVAHPRTELVITASQRPRTPPRRTLSFLPPSSVVSDKMVSILQMVGWTLGLTVGAAIAALYWFQDNLLYFPQIFNSRTVFDDPARYDLTHEEVFLRTPDDVRIQVRVLRSHAA